MRKVASRNNVGTGANLLHYPPGVGRSGVVQAALALRAVQLLKRGWSSCPMLLQSNAINTVFGRIVVIALQRDASKKST